MLPSADDPTTAGSSSSESDSLVSRLLHLRGVRWRINLCNFPSSSIDDLRRGTADSRRRYAALRRRLLVDPHILKDGSSSHDLAMDNPLSENPDSMWGRFFRNAELEKMLDQDLSRLYPEHGSYFQTLGCQSILRRILLLWCLRHPEYGYGQGMHELLAPLLYVLHADLQRLAEARKIYEDHFTDKFDDALFQENDLKYNFDFRRSPDVIESDASFLEKAKMVVSLDELNPETRIIVLLSDVYGAEGELGVILSEKFMEHDVYCMFDALMSGAGGAVAMAEFFSPSTGIGSHAGISPALEASSELYHLLSVVDSPLYSHLVELGVEPQYFALRWLRVLFGREFSLEDLLIIWDEIFSFDNVKVGTAAEDEPGSYYRVLSSHRGAFISSMAVCMMLNLRSSLLAAETATSCLQRLLNFPAQIELRKLIEEAKSLMPLAMEANTSSSSAASGSYGKIKTPVVRGHSLSFDSASLKAPLISVPESYWEDKWRDLHKEEELRKERSFGKQTSSSKKSWTEKLKSRLYRTESDPSPSISPSKRDGMDEPKSSVRRNLLGDLSLQLGETIGDIGEDSSSKNQKDPFQDESSLGQLDVQEDSCCVQRTSSEQTTISDENSTIILNSVSPERESNSFVNEVEKGDVDSNALRNVDVKSEQIGLFSSNTEDQLVISDQSDASVSPKSDSLEILNVGSSPEIAAIDSSSSNDKKSLPGKFQWLLKLGRHQSGEGNSDEVDASEVVKSRNEGHLRSTMVEQPAAIQICSHVSDNGNVLLQNQICTLRNLGQSMLENIEVIESVFQQDVHEAASLDNLSKDVILENGQVTAISALEELRKISNLLRGM
ncbi:hypothetical protein V2J09_000282 [Rumex salicifolius]